MENAKTIKECLHAYGIHSATLQPELAQSRPPTSSTETTEATAPIIAPAAAPITIATPATPATTAIHEQATSIAGSSTRRRRVDDAACRMACGSLCESLTCCSVPTKIV